MNEASRKPADERRRNLWGAVAGTIAFAVLGVVFAPGLATRETPSRTESKLTPAHDPTASEPSRALPLATPDRQADPNARSFDCMISPNEVIDIGSDVRGRIREIGVERGDYVEAGQVLAQIESSVEEAAARAARARAERLVEIEASTTNLALGQKRRDRARQLFDRNALSLDTRDEVEAKATLAALELEQSRENHRLAEIQLEQSVADLERRTIRSPISGYVVERLMSPGEVIDEEAMLRIAQVDPLRVEAILPADWFGRPQIGGRAEVVPEAPLDAPRDAEVTIVDPVLDGASGTFGVRLRLPNPDRVVPAGLRCQVRFLAGGERPAPAKEGAAAPFAPDASAQHPGPTPSEQVVGPLAGS